MTHSDISLRERLIAEDVEGQVCDLPHMVTLLSVLIEHLGFYNRLDDGEFHRLTQGNAENVTFVVGEIQARASHLKAAFYEALENGSDN